MTNLVGESADVTHNASGADYAGVTFTVPVTVNDDDSASLVLEGLTNGGLTVNETDSEVTVSFMVKLSAEPARAVTVAVTKSGSADVTIASGSDERLYNSAPATIGTAQEVSIQRCSRRWIATTKTPRITLTASGAEFAGKAASVVRFGD